ncbi:chitinase, partial [Streptomyces albiflaviniger]|nr:chitinase [Streptomyces albiflaviniger]
MPIRRALVATAATAAAGISALALPPSAADAASGTAQDSSSVQAAGFVVSPAQYQRMFPDKNAF